jgi:hypothetical protein
LRSGTARRLRGRVDLVMGGSNWWSIPQWPPTAYTRWAEAANAAIAAHAPGVFGRYVGAPVAHAAIAGEFSCPMPELVGCQNSIGLWNAAVFRSPAVDRCLLCWGPVDCTQASVSSGFSRLGHSPPAPPIE